MTKLQCATTFPFATMFFVAALLKVGEWSFITGLPKWIQIALFLVGLAVWFGICFLIAFWDLIKKMIDDVSNPRFDSWNRRW